MTRSNRLGGWCRLGAAGALLWGTVAFAIPWIGKWETFQPLGAYIAETGIDAAAIYYTDVEATGEAEIHTRSAVAFPMRSALP